MGCCGLAFTLHCVSLLITEYCRSGSQVNLTLQVSLVVAVVDRPIDQSFAETRLGFFRLLSLYQVPSCCCD